MDVALLFFLPLLGGFLFVVSFYGTRYRVARQETQRVYYQAAFWGALLSVAGLIFHHQLERHSESYKATVDYLRQHMVDPLLERPTTAGAPAPSAASVLARGELAFACIWGFLLGAATPLLNILIVVVDWMWVLALARRMGLPSLRQMINRSSIRDQFELLLTEALIQANQVQVTLINQKVYTGWVTQSVNPESQEKYVRLQPTLSGFRSKDTGEVQFTTKYSDVLRNETDKRKLRSFQIVIPIDKVISASGFDPTAYHKYQESRVSSSTPDEPSKHEVEHSGELTVHLVGAQVATQGAPPLPAPPAVPGPAEPGNPGN